MDIFNIIIIIIIIIIVIVTIVESYNSFSHMSPMCVHFITFHTKTLNGDVRTAFAISSKSQQVKTNQIYNKYIII